MTLKTQFPAPTGKALSSPDNRADLAGLVVRTTAGAPRPGLLPRTTAALGTARATMGIDVAAFEAVMVRNGLPAFMANDGTVTVSIGNAPGANSRYDIVYAKQNESASPFSDGNDNEIFGYVSGVAAPIPDLAAAIALVPAGGLPLVAVLIPSTATTTQSAGVIITQVAPFTALTGNPIWVRTSSDLAALTGFAVDHRAWTIDTKVEYRFDGTTWKGWASDWITFAPTVGGITLGNGTLTARMKYRDGDLKVEGIFILGSSSAVAGPVRITHPVAAASLASQYSITDDEIGTATVLDAGVAPYKATITSVSTTTADVRALDASVARALHAGVNGTSPINPFGTGDSIMWRYEITPA